MLESVTAVVVRLLDRHALVAGAKFPPLLLSVARSPRTMSYPVAPVIAPQESRAFAPALPTLSVGVPDGGAGAGLQFHSVWTLNGLAPLDANVIHPMFSPQAWPLNYPVATSISTPPVPGAKLIQPAFSDQA